LKQPDASSSDISWRVCEFPSCNPVPDATVQIVIRYFSHDLLPRFLLEAGTMLGRIVQEKLSDSYPVTAQFGFIVSQSAYEGVVVPFAEWP
jgi:hypothetical protein